MDQNIVSTLIGGGLALAGTAITLYVQRRHNKADQRESEIDLLRSVQCEFSCLSALIKDRHDEFLGNTVGEDGYIDSWFLINQNYFAYFDQNYSNFPKIKSSELKLKIQKTVLYGKSYVDSVLLHNQLLNSILEHTIRYNHTETTYDLEKYKFSLELLKEFDAGVMDQAKSLYKDVNELVSDIEAYTKLL